MECISHSPEATQALAARLGELALPGTVLVLAGPLGAGKTSFVQGLARGLGILGVVNSPTFTLVKEYWGRLPLFHFDLYRLNDPAELWELGFDEYLSGGGVTALEWGERAGEFLPQEHLLIRLAAIDEQQRSIVFSPTGAGYQRLVEELRQSAGFGN